jgi:hypothetical protein
MSSEHYAGGVCTVHRYRLVYIPNIDSASAAFQTSANKQQPRQEKETINQQPGTTVDWNLALFILFIPVSCFYS